jgi:hypothetical protein
VFNVAPEKTCALQAGGFAPVPVQLGNVVTPRFRTNEPPLAGTAALVTVTDNWSAATVPTLELAILKPDGAITFSEPIEGLPDGAVFVNVAMTESDGEFTDAGLVVNV